MSSSRNTTSTFDDFEPEKMLDISDQIKSLQRKLGKMEIQEQPQDYKKTTEKIRKNLKNLTIQDMVYPEQIEKVVTTVKSRNEVPGEIKIGKEGKLLQEFLQFEGLTKPMIQCFDNWVSVLLPQRILSTEIKFALGTVKFEDVAIYSPIFGTEEKYPKFPRDARNTRTTYSATINAKIKFIPNGTNPDVEDEKRTKTIKIGEIPLMLGSQFCHLYKLNAKQLIDVGECDKDPYGYFIIEGQEKIVLQHEKLRVNKPVIFQDGKIKKTGEKSQANIMEPVNMKSKKRDLSPTICRFTAMTSIGTTIVNLSYDLKVQSMILRLQGFHQDAYLNIFYVFELFGYTKTEDMKSMILTYIPDKEKTEILIFLTQIQTEYLNNRNILSVLKSVMKFPERLERESDEAQMDHFRKIVSVNLFRQIDSTLYPDEASKNHAKLQMLSVMIARYSRYLNNFRAWDDRDSWSNKRIISAGSALEQLFNSIWNVMVEQLLFSEYLSKISVNEPSFTIDQIVKMWPANYMKDTFVKSFSPNTWGIQGTVKENMTDFLKNETLLAKYSQLLRISPTTSDKGKQTSIRLVQPTQLGYVCPIETPEGKQCGIVKGMAVGCYVSIQRSEGTILQFLQDNEMFSAVKTRAYHCALILNGKFLGWCQGKIDQDRLRNARRASLLDRDILIYYEEPNMLWIYSDNGRPTRPLLLVNPKTNRLLIEELDLWNASFAELLKAGVLEYIDALEQEYILLAQSIWDPVFKLENLEKIEKSVTKQRDPFSFASYKELVAEPQYTHCEMDPNAMLSVLASIIPMPDREQAPRNVYQCSMGKQALGIQNTNAINRFDTEVKSLAYPQRPIFETQMYSHIGIDELPIGETVTVAVMPFEGYNQEDSIIINQSAVDMGRFRIVRTITYKTIQMSNHKEFTEEIRKPLKKIKNEEFLDEQGIILPGSYVKQGDCLIGKVKTYHATHEKVDASIYVGVGDSGIVERVLKTSSLDSKTIVLVKIREVRKPRAGDKCACFPIETEILTKNRGWISIKDVKTEDYVASLDNGKLTYVQPEATQEYDYEGDMYSLTSNQVDLMVTPNHNLFVKQRNSNSHELIRADEVFGTRVNHKKNAINDLPDQEFFVLPACVYNYKKQTVNAEEKRIPMNAWLKLFGIWMAEGCANSKHVKICAHKQRVREVLDEIESELGVEFSKTRDKKFDEELKCVYYILDRQFCDYLEKLSVGAVNKKLPEWCFELSQSQSQILLTSMVLGDGNVSKSNCVKYYTSSQQLANHVQILALHAGWSGNLRKRFDAGHSVWLEARQEYITATEDAYEITIVKKKNEPQINHGHTKTQKGQKEEWVPYNGKVYCCTVPSGVIYIRHNNKPVWCGNSRYAQKGTIGIVRPAADMPFISEGPAKGLSPDIIINPISLPSRMTLGKVIEIISSKVGAMKGERVNATAFRNFDLDSFMNILGSYGFNREGFENMRDGRTGEEYDVPIYTGPCYYQALRHHVKDKIQSRGRGPVKITTRQPTAGRSRGGGIRVGEMERDALISHGASSCQKEKTFDHSDAYKTIFCKNCGTVPNINKINLDMPCMKCGKAEYGLVSIPYSFKVLTHELAAGGILLSLKLKNKDKEIISQ